MASGWMSSFTCERNKAARASKSCRLLHHGKKHIVGDALAATRSIIRSEWISFSEWFYPIGARTLKEFHSVAPRARQDLERHQVNVPLSGCFVGQGRPGVSFLENVRLLGTIYKCQRSSRRRVLERGMESICHDQRNMRERQPQAVSKSVDF